MANGNFGGGTGTASDPYLVEDAADLQGVNLKLTYCFKQVKDINMNDFPEHCTGLGWWPLGSSAYPFRGYYDGNGKTISNLYINRPTESHLGLFGLVLTNDTSTPAVKNLTLKNVNIAAGVDNVAGLIGATGYNVRIENCSVEGIIRSNVKTGNATGLLVGKYRSNSTNCLIKKLQNCW